MSCILAVMTIAVQDSTHHEQHTADVITLDTGASVDANGYWHTTARFARAGIQLYELHEMSSVLGSHTVPGAKVRVLRPESVVFDRGFMDSFAHVPITLEHEGGLVGRGNTRSDIRGVTKAPVTNTDGQLTVPVVIYDRSVIDDAATGKCRELSAGYTGRFVYAPGHDDKWGDYDVIFKGGNGNHVTITKRGKAGESYYIGDRVSDKIKVDDSKVRRTVNGVDYLVSSQTAQVMDHMSAQTSAVSKELGVAKAEIKELKEKVEKATVSDSEIDELVEARSDVLSTAKQMKIEVADKDGKAITTDGVKRLVVGAMLKGTSLDGKSDEYVQALYDHVKTAANKADEGKSKPSGKNKAVSVTTGDSDGGDTIGVAAKARAQFIAQRSGREVLDTAGKE